MNMKNMYLILQEEDSIEKMLKEQEISRKELKSRVKLLKTWLENQPHLPNCMEENEIQNFLWGCKASMEITKQKIDAYYSIRCQMPEIFHNRDPCSKEMLRCYTSGYVYPLPQLTKEGYRVIIATLTPNISDFNFVRASQTVIDTCDILILKDSLPAGQYIILDGIHTSMGHVLKVHPALLRKAIYYIQAVLPNQIKGVFVINGPYVIDLIQMTFMPLLTKKLQQRVHILNGDHTELYQYIDRKILPKDYGGEESTIKDLQSRWQRVVESHRDWFMNEGTVMSDESKRLGKEHLNIENPQFGVNGSFKQLEID